MHSPPPTGGGSTTLAGVGMVNKQFVLEIACQRERRDSPSPFARGGEWENGSYRERQREIKGRSCLGAQQSTSLSNPCLPCMSACQLVFPPLALSSTPGFLLFSLSLFVGPGWATSLCLHIGEKLSFPLLGLEPPFPYYTSVNSRSPDWDSTTTGTTIYEERGRT